MKKLLSAALLMVVLISAPVFASHYWKLDMSTPKSLINSRTFNLQFTTLSVERNDDITVEAFRDGTSVGTITAVKDYGDSGAFNVTVPSDGTFEFHLTGTNGSEEKTTPSANVTVDTAAPNKPTYSGFTKSGNEYTLTFTAPSNSDVVSILVYSSASNTFTANSSTRVGTVSVAPGETKTFTYTAAGSDRHHAIQSLDSAGNVSGLVGDPNILVSQNTVGGGDSSSGGSTTGDSASTQATSDDQNVAGATDQSAAANEDNSDKSFPEKVKDNWSYVLIGLAAILLAYYALALRQGAPFNRRRP